MEGRSKASENGNTTRLQKRAPASLELDKIYNGFPNNPFAPSKESSNAIPLLSPLVLSPQAQPLLETKEVRMSENGNGNNNVQGSCCSSSSSMPTTGWQHPAMDPPFPDPSSLFSFFQKQCVIVNHAQ